MLMFLQQIIGLLIYVHQKWEKHIEMCFQHNGNSADHVMNYF